VGSPKVTAIIACALLETELALNQLSLHETINTSRLLLPVGCSSNSALTVKAVCCWNKREIVVSVPAVNVGVQTECHI
jgi:hypothetical protein